MLPTFYKPLKFSKQLEYLQAMKFENHHTNLQALIATEVLLFASSRDPTMPSCFLVT